MNYDDIDIDSIKLINGDCLVEIHSVTEDEIPFNGTTLKLINKVSNYKTDFTHNDFNSVMNRLRKSNFRDQQAMAEYSRMRGEMMGDKKAVENNIESKQAVRHGKIVRLPHSSPDRGNWDYACEFDGQVGDEVYFESTYTRNLIEEGQGAIEKDGKKYLLVPTLAIYAAKRGDEIVSLNGYIIGKRLSNDIKVGSLFMPESRIAKIEVVEPPRRIPKFYNDEVWKNTKVKKGDIVYMKDVFAIKLDSTLAETTDLVRFQSRIILAIEE